MSFINQIVCDDPSCKRVEPVEHFATPPDGWWICERAQSRSISNSMMNAQGTVYVDQKYFCPNCAAKRLT